MSNETVIEDEYLLTKSQDKNLTNKLEKQTDDAMQLTSTNRPNEASQSSSLIEQKTFKRKALLTK